MISKYSVLGASKPMTIAEWLFVTMEKLGKAGVDAPRRDALVLLEDTLGKDRAWVLAHPEFELAENILEKVNLLIKRRLNREPLAYIRGKAWFYKRFFTVTPDVMIPRPESESFIELIKQLQPKAIADVGTGSGCLAITAKLELPDAEVIAIDTSDEALTIARKNAAKHNVELKFLPGSLLEPLYTLNAQPYALLANLPYVPEGLVTSPEIKQEPPEALFSGQDGLDHYREFWWQIANNSQFVRIKYVLTESLETQHKEMVALAKRGGYRLEKTDVLVQLFVSS